MKKQQNQERPKMTASQALGEVGETAVQLILKKFSWTADIIKSDYGEDIECNIFIDNSRTNYHLRCQVKSTSNGSKYVKELMDGNFSIAINSSILKAWLTSYFPILLIIYEERTELCYWCNPITQILNNPSKLEKKRPTVLISKKNILDYSSKEAILEEIKKFYRKIQRLDEAKICCDVIPVLMPNHRVIPFHAYMHLLQKKGKITLTISSKYLELLPSWMSVLNRLDPSPILTSILLESENMELDDFLKELKLLLKSFPYILKKKEWISFIVSPIKIQSTNSSWFSELTYWTSYSKIGDSIINDFEYNFEAPKSLIKQITRRSQSWDFLHFVDISQDIAVQFFGSYVITPTIKNIDQIHSQNIRGQFVLWKCENNQIDFLRNVISKYELAVQIIDETERETLLAITTQMFDPFIGLYVLPKDWNTFENGNVKSILNQNDLHSVLPGMEYAGAIPEFLQNALDKYNNKNYKKTLIIEMDYIDGFPLELDERQILVSRFQMISLQQVRTVKSKLGKVKSKLLKNYTLEFGIKDDYMWTPAIYELSLAFSPELTQSSKEAYFDKEKMILGIFNEVLPTKKDSSLILKNTYDVLHIAGQIGFENR